MRAGLLLALCSCASPSMPAVDPFTVFPYGVAPDPDRPDFVDARVETETWVPGVDIEETAAYVRKALEHYPGGPPEVLDHFEEHRPTLPTLDPSSPVWIDLAGDLLPAAGAPGERTELGRSIAPMRRGEVGIANLESPTAPGFDTSGLYDLNTDPTALDTLPFEMLQLNNNHSLDAGPGGLAATVREVTQRGRTPLGIDTHRIVPIGGVNVGVLSYTWGLNVDPADVALDGELAVDLFVVPFGHEGTVDTSRIGDEVAHLRGLGAELIVLLVHWGYEYEYYPDPHFLVLGRQLVSEGADLVVGTGPHVAQPAEVCAVDTPGAQPGLGRCVVRTAENRARTAAILYSLGNASSNMKSSWPTLAGLLATVSLDPDRGVTGLGWQPLITLDSDHTEPPYDLIVPLEDPGTDDPDLLEALEAESRRLDAHLGDHWRL